jgi:hypothetical protein
MRSLSTRESIVLAWFDRLPNSATRTGTYDVTDVRSTPVMPLASPNRQSSGNACGLPSTIVAISTAVVVAVGVASEIFFGNADGAGAGDIVALLSLSYEANVPTWYASSLLLSCALLLAGIAHNAATDRRHWAALAALFCYMSLDEAAELHERLGGLVGGSGVFYFDWVIPASVVVAVIGAAYWRFVWRLPARLRRSVITAGALYVTGALLLELPLGYWTERAGPDNLTYALIDACEEGLELAGASLFAVALWSYLQHLLRGSEVA